MKVEPLLFNNDLLEAIADEPCAPGTPVTLEIDGMRISAKSRGTTQRDDGRYHLKVRLTGLRRSHRERLHALLD